MEHAARRAEHHGEAASVAGALARCLHFAPGNADLEAGQVTSEAVPSRRPAIGLDTDAKQGYIQAMASEAVTSTHITAAVTTPRRTGTRRPGLRPLEPEGAR